MRGVAEKKQEGAGQARNKPVQPAANSPRIEGSMQWFDTYVRPTYHKNTHMPVDGWFQPCRCQDGLTGDVKSDTPKECGVQCEDQPVCAPSPAFLDFPSDVSMSEAGDASQMDNIEENDTSNLDLKRWQSEENPGGVWTSDASMSTLLQRALQGSNAMNIDSAGLVKSISCYLDVSDANETQGEECISHMQSLVPHKAENKSICQDVRSYTNMEYARKEHSL